MPFSSQRLPDLPDSQRRELFKYSQPRSLSPRNSSPESEISVSLSSGKPTIRSRVYFGTLNNPEKLPGEIFQSWFDTGKIKWLVGQLERAESHTPHLQFILSFSILKSLSSAKKILGQRVHLEIPRSIPDSISYCQKSDTRVSGPFLYGDPPLPKVEKKTLTVNLALGLTYEEKLELPINQFL